MGSNADKIPIHSESDSWLSRRSIAFKLTAIVLVFVCFILALLGVVSLSSALNNGARAYVGAEGLWSKAQRDAVYYLTRYVRSHDEQDYRKYLAAIAVPLGDHAARLEMGKPSYDYDAAARGFAQGGNVAVDVPYMIFLFRYFHNAPRLAEAIRIWTEADVHIARLTQSADELHAAALSGSLASERATADLNQIEDINLRLAPLERSFSTAMSDGARWIRHVLLITIFSAATLLLIVGLWVSSRIARGLRAGILSLREGALRVAQGDLDHPIAVQSHDELGELARVFNRMIAQRKHAEEALLNESALKNAIFNSTYFSSIVTDAKGVIQIFNVGAEHMLGYKAADVVNKITPVDLHDQQEAIEHAKALSLEFATPIAPGLEALFFKATRGIQDIYELTKVRKDGSRFAAMVSVTALRNAQNVIIGYLLIGTDITAHKQLEELLQESEQRASHILDAAHSAFVAIDFAGKITDWNVQAQRLFGWSRQEAVGRSVAEMMIPPQFHDAYMRGLQHFLMTGEGPALNKTIEVGALHHDGRVIPIEVSIGAIKSREGYAFHAFIRDITERKETEKRLKDLAYFDPLTGLPNRRHYTESLEQALVLAAEQGVSVSVLFIDLDRFKNVNDTLGHALGDDLLRKVSARMIKCLRTSDILGRLGGDEFALILMDSSDARATAIVANTIINELHRPFDLDGHEVTVTASIGITVFPADSSDAATLMKYADTAMYEAKNAGRDTYRFYTAEMYARAQEKHDLENALRRAIDHDEFVLYYQPTMQIDTGQWTGVEALLRWDRPGHGLILPVDFIPTLEETGLIVPVGAWVIDTACKQIAEWERSGIGLVAVAVNVSGRQFVQGDPIQEEMPALRDDDSSFPLLDFVRGAEKALSEHHIAANLLAFELTESTLMSEAEKTVGILQKLKSLGIRISIDDFGTGYSSLAYLRRFPIDTLKIDQAFIRDVTTNAEDAAITQAIINMAHSLKLKAIAEGVETTEQLEFLRTHGCDQAQGYLLARPMPAAELTQLFRAGKRSSTAVASAA